MKFVLPPEIRVCPAQGREKYEEIRATSRVEPTSRLFRKGTGIGLTLGAVHTRTDKDRSLRVISAGCSFGAEIDTVLGLAHNNIPKRSMSVLGVDMNAELLEAAESGLYHSYEDLDRLRRLYDDQYCDFDDEMRSHGVAVSPETTSGEGKDHVNLSADLLRARYAVTLQTADIRTDIPNGALADLILCHNVIYHQSTEEARATVGTLAGHVALNGILSFGATLNTPGFSGSQGSQTYGEWWDEVTDMVSMEGLVPFESDSPSLVAYERVA